MVKPSHILGMNARVQIYTSQNSKKAKSYGFSKLRSKAFLAKHGVQVAQLYARITSQEELRSFDWHDISGTFAVKPASGSAGKGIIVIKGKIDHDTWEDIGGEQYTEDELDLHVRDILDGQYSTWGSHHMAIIEERVPIHPDLEPYVRLGTPDVRVIVYRRIPVMAMIRLPTESSRGRANLDQGAIGLGIDMGTGRTTYGVSGKKKIITYLPHSNEPVSGILIPYWFDVLKTAIRAANATGLTYMGADIFIHPEKGPMVAEVNAFPGLSIQLANQAGLRQRLERIEGVSARNVVHAAKIGQALFAESYPGTTGEGEKPIIHWKETIKVKGDDERYHDILTRMNTTRFRSAIAEKVATELRLNEMKDKLWNQQDEEEGNIPVVPVTIKVKDRIIHTDMLVSRKLNHKKHDMELGRKDLGSFLITGEEA